MLVSLGAWEGFLAVQALGRLYHEKDTLLDRPLRDGLSDDSQCSPHRKLLGRTPMDGIHLKHPHT